MKRPPQLFTGLAAAFTGSTGFVSGMAIGVVLEGHTENTFVRYVVHWSGNEHCRRERSALELSAGKNSPND